MFEFKKIKGNTFLIRNGTNIGVYIFEDKTAVLIDTGLGGKPAEAVINCLKENSIKVEYIINTHEHWDHCGANYQIKREYGDVKTYASEKSRLYIENPDEFMDFFNGGRRFPYLHEVVKKNILNPDEVYKTVEPGQELNLKGHKFKVFDCSGHTGGSIGIITDDGVAFFGDQMISENSLNKLDFVFIYDHKFQEKSLENLKKIKFNCGILGHSSQIFSAKEILEAADYNREALFRVRELVAEILKSPKTIDEIMRDFFRIKEIEPDYLIYLECRGSIMAAIEYLIEIKKVYYDIDNCMLKYRIAGNE